MSLTSEQRLRLIRMEQNIHRMLEEDEPPAPPKPGAIQWGFDISDHQGPNVNFASLESEDYSFCFVKASEGIGWKAKNYRLNIARAKIAGIIPGAYHFLWGNDPVKQVNTFLSVVGDPDGVMLAVDVETYNGQVPPRKQHLWGFLRELTKRVGKETPIVVYSGDWYYLSATMNNPQFSELEKEGIKVAVWSTPNTGYVEGPGYGSALYEQVPSNEWLPGYGFGGKAVDILQFSAEASAGGIYPLDVNAFRGSREELLRYVHSSKEKPEEPQEADDGRKLLEKIEDYGEAILGTPYGIWKSGDVPEEEPAWAKNAPPPKPSYVRERSAFCIAPSNLLRRLCDLQIPYRRSVDPKLRDRYDGGTWAYQEFFRRQREPFKLTDKDGKPWPPLTFFGRFWAGGGSLGSQGHGALMWFNGKLHQSFISNFESGAPGVNKGVTLKDSHHGGYYDYVIRREHMFPSSVVKALESLESEALLRVLAEDQESESNQELLEAHRIYQRWTEGFLKGEMVATEKSLL